MPQPRKSLPRYLKHACGKGRIVWTDATGTRREKLLPGAYNSPESWYMNPPTVSHPLT